MRERQNTSAQNRGHDSHDRFTERSHDLTVDDLPRRQRERNNDSHHQQRHVHALSQHADNTLVAGGVRLATNHGHEVNAVLTVPILTDELTVESAHGHILTQPQHHRVEVQDSVRRRHADTCGYAPARTQRFAYFVGFRLVHVVGFRELHLIVGDKVQAGTVIDLARPVKQHEFGAVGSQIFHTEHSTLSRIILETAGTIPCRRTLHVIAHARAQAAAVSGRDNATVGPQAASGTVGGSAV